MENLIREGRLEELKEFIKRSGPLNGVLHLACCWNEIEIIEFLLEEGFNINKKDEHGKTPLQYAVSHASLEAVKLLLEKKADIRKKDKFGISPLSLACKLRNHSSPRRRYNEIYKEIIKAR